LSKRRILAAALSALALAAGAFGATASAQQAAAGDIPQGHRLALSMCASCHVVDAEHPTVLLPKPAAPSFETIAGRPGMTADVLRTMLRAHQAYSPNRPAMFVGDDQVPPIVAYIMSLKARR
jgi:mono/diheme cytochrome c family protein